MWEVSSDSPARRELFTKIGEANSFPLRFKSIFIGLQIYTLFYHNAIIFGEAQYSLFFRFVLKHTLIGLTFAGIKFRGFKLLQPRNFKDFAWIYFCS